MMVYGGPDVNWYYAIFDHQRTSAIPGHIAYTVGSEKLHEWADQFRRHWNDGWRDDRADLITFIADLSISKEDFITSQEWAFYGGFRPREEIEALIHWGRYVNANWENYRHYHYSKTVDVPMPNGRIIADVMISSSFMWMWQHSISEIEALVSGCVYKLWEAFPGYGVVQNGRGYSPEWILNNISRAINEEQIPLEEIQRILDRAAHYAALDEVVAMAIAEAATVGAEFHVVIPIRQQWVYEYIPETSPMDYFRRLPGIVSPEGLDLHMVLIIEGVESVDIYDVSGNRLIQEERIIFDISGNRFTDFICAEIHRQTQEGTLEKIGLTHQFGRWERMALQCRFHVADEYVLRNIVFADNKPIHITIMTFENGIYTSVIQYLDIPISDHLELRISPNTSQLSDTMMRSVIEPTVVAPQEAINSLNEIIAQQHVAFEQ